MTPSSIDIVLNLKKKIKKILKRKLHFTFLNYIPTFTFVPINYENIYLPSKLDNQLLGFSCLMEPLIDHEEHGERKGEVLRQLGFSNCMQPTSVIIGSK